MQKSLAALIAVSAIVLSTALLSHTAPSTYPVFDKALLEEFTQWAKMHNKVYKTPSEKLHRMKIFAQTNIKLIETMKDKSLTYTVGHNMFSDMTVEEVLPRKGLSLEQAKRNYEAKKASKTESKLFKSEHIVDWREEGAVTAVRDQTGQCAGDYAIVTSEALEGVHAIASQQLIQLSPQQIIDCSNNYGNSGCFGGSVPKSMQYTFKVGGLESEQDYPFTQKEEKCVFNESLIKASMRGFESNQGGCNSLQKEINQRPVTVEIAATSLIQYKNGIYNNPHCGTNLNHYMLAIGYGATEDPDSVKNYFLLKNSWGSHWGEEGYIRIANVGGTSDIGLCGVCYEEFWPIF